MTPAVIINAVTQHYGLSRDAIRGPRRSLRTSIARYMAQYIMRQQLRLSYPDIGKETKRDHTTALHGVRKMAAKIEQQDGAHRDYQAIIATITKVECVMCPHCLRPFEGESLTELRGELEKLTARVEVAAMTRAA